MKANVYALAAIALWSTLAAIGVALRHLPPFLLTGIALLVGSTLALPLVARRPQLWKIPATTLALGVYGLFGFHFLLFIALRYAPPVEANLVNYLWPLLLVLLAPVFLPGLKLRALHVVAALMGFGGAAIAILGAGGNTANGGWYWGYLPAMASAFFLWDKALKLGDARQIGILSYLTPLCSTALLMLTQGRALSWNIGLAAVMILGAAVLGTRAK